MTKIKQQPVRSPMQDFAKQPSRSASKRRKGFSRLPWYVKLIITVALLLILAALIVGSIRLMSPAEFISPLGMVKEIELVTPVLAKVEAKSKPKTVEEMIREKFGDKSRVALAVAMCESRLHEGAIGDRHLNPRSYGVYQIRAFRGRPSASALLQAETNIDYAYTLSQAGTSWVHWSCFTSGKYKRFLATK